MVLLVNNYVNDQIQVLYHKNIENKQFAKNGVVLDAIATGKILRTIIDEINSTLNITVQRVVLTLPSHSLMIYQSQAMLDFKDANHVITNYDCSKVIEMVKNIIIDSNQVICLTKPYTFKVDTFNAGAQLPIGIKGQIIHVNALVYALPKVLYNSQLAVLAYAQCDLLTMTLDQFALACNVNNNDMNNHVVIVDWNLDYTKVSIFNNSVLYASTTIKIGWNQIVESVMTQMRCGYDKAEKYLQKIINISSNYLSDVIIDKFIDEHTKLVVGLTKSDLQTTVKKRINEIIDCIEYFLNQVSNNNSAEMQVIFTGATLRISGFVAYIKNYSKLKNIKYMLNQNPGAYSYLWATLIGVTHYQHLVNVFSSNFISSIMSLNTLPKINHNIQKKRETKYYNSFLQKKLSV